MSASRKCLRYLAVLFFIIASTLPSSAEAVVYSPGATLDPACAPGPGCTVKILGVYDEGALATSTTVSGIDFVGAGVVVSASTTATGFVTITIPGGASSAWELLGNAGTNDAVNFIGTTDAEDLVFRTNNTEKLRISQEGRLLTTNAFDGIFIQGGNETMTGTGNIGFGSGALSANTTGLSNIALGQNALLFNTTGFSNMAIGQAALLFNNGNTNTAIGQGAGISSTGNSNTYIGYASRTEHCRIRKCIYRV